MKEFNKLVEMLEKQKMHYQLLSMQGGEEIVLLDDYGQIVDSAIYSPHCHGYKEGLLESCSLGSCKGYETAEKVFKGWKKMLQKQNELYL